MQHEPPTWQRHGQQRAVGSCRPNGRHKKGAKKYKRITGPGGFPSAKEHQAPNQTDPVPGAMRAAGAAAAPQEESVVLRPHSQADGRLQPGIPAASQSAGDKGPLRHSWSQCPTHVCGGVREPQGHASRARMPGRGVSSTHLPLPAKSLLPRRPEYA